MKWVCFKLICMSVCLCVCVCGVIYIFRTDLKETTNLYMNRFNNLLGPRYIFGETSLGKDNF